MKKLLLANLLLAFAQIPTPTAAPLPIRISGEISQTGEGAIEGLVKRQNSEEPISGVAVTLTGGPAGLTDTVGQLTAATEGDGRFFFPNLPAGRYSISLRRDGYFSTRALARTGNPEQIVVGPGRSTRAVSLSMTRGGIISGRILDPVGRPAPATIVTAARVFYQDARPVLGPVKSSTTDDRGDYRLFWLEPGEYLLVAEKSLPTGPARGYFPGGDDARSAIHVKLAEGEETSRNDFSLGMIPASVTVTGSVTVVVPGFETQLNLQSRDSVAPRETPTPADVRAIQANAALQFYLLPLDAGRIYEGPALFANTITNSQDRAAGKFELRNVRRGSYELYVVLQDRATSPSKYYVTHRTVDVGDQNLDGLALLLAPGIDLKGTIRAGNGISVASARVFLRPRGILPGWTGTSVVSTDGKFSIPNVPESQYSIAIEPSEPNAYVSQLVQGRGSIVDRGIVTVSQTLSDTLEAVIEAPAATIGGTVLAPPSQLAAGIMVTLVPEDSRRENLALYQRVIAIDGAFSFAGVVPGKYKLFAWQMIPDGAEQNPEFMEAYKNNGVEVVASSGSTSSAELRLSPE